MHCHTLLAGVGLLLSLVHTYRQRHRFFKLLFIYFFTVRKGKVMFSHVSVCPQSASRESSNARPCYGVVGTHPTGRFSCSFLLPPTAKLREGNVFTPLCHSVHRLGGGGSVQGGCAGLNPLSGTI